MKNNNLIVREALKENGVYLYELFDALNFGDSKGFRLFRKELSIATQNEWTKIIRKLGEEKNARLKQ